MAREKAQRTANVIHTNASAIEKVPFEDSTSVVAGVPPVLGIAPEFLCLRLRAMCLNPELLIPTISPRNDPRAPLSLQDRQGRIRSLHWAPSKIWPSNRAFHGTFELVGLCNVCLRQGDPEPSWPTPSGKRCGANLQSSLLQTEMYP